MRFLQDRAQKQAEGYEFSTDELLEKLIKYGRPALFCAEDLTWSCKIHLNTDKMRFSAEAHSGFNHPTARSAVVALFERLHEVEEV